MSAVAISRVDHDVDQLRAQGGSILRRLLEDVKQIKDGFMASCPSHDDETPSFHYSEKSRRGKCYGCRAYMDVFDYARDHAGCSTFPEQKAWVADQAGIAPAQVVPRPKATSRPTKRQPLGPTVARYDYRNADGKLLYWKTRHEPKTFRFKHADAEGRERWGRGEHDPMLYRLPELINSKCTCLIVEGEKDVRCAIDLGFAAVTCAPDGAKSWEPEWGKYFEGRSVVLIPDRDAEGRAYAADILRSLGDLPAGIAIIDVPEAHKDLSEFVEGGGTVRELGQRMRVIFSKGGQR